MCLLTYLPPLAMPDVEALATGASTNRDGHGFAILIPKHNRILVRKSMKPTELIVEFARLRLMYPDGPAIFHSRITTDGETTKYNVHPFMVEGDKRTIMAHNGIFPGSVRPGKNDRRSDTRIVAEEVAAGFRLHTARGRDIMEEWMGYSSKAVILTVDPLFDQYSYILNERLGSWHKGIWYSNTSYRDYKYETKEVVWNKETGWWEDSDGVYRSRVWEACLMCEKDYAVNPRTLICFKCKLCAACGAKPCECDLAPATGKELATIGHGSTTTRAATGGVEGVVIGSATPEPEGDIDDEAQRLYQEYLDDQVEQGFADLETGEPVDQLTEARLAAQLWNAGVDFSG